MIRAIRYFGDDVLRQPAAQVGEFDESLHRLVRDLFDTQAKMRGLGLAAVQIGIEQHVFSTDFSSLKRSEKPQVLVNAQVVDSWGSATEEEGCLSFPGLFAHVTRPNGVIIRAYDAEGNEIEREVKGYLARAFLHEIDHLEGRLFIDLVDPDERSRIVAEMAKFRRRLKSMKGDMPDTARRNQVIG